MDLTDPTRSVTGTLDGPVLAVLAQTGRPLTVGEIAKQSARGSELGIRKSLARLTEQGIVRATEIGKSRVHELNREHVAAPIASLLSGLRLELWKRFRSTLTQWKPRPLYAYVFGSAARADGTVASDIDLMLVRSPLRSERNPRRRAGGAAPILGLAVEFVVEPMSDQMAVKWDENVDRLRDEVHAWTGNPLQVLEMSVFEWAEHLRRETPISYEIQRDGISVGPAHRQFSGSVRGR